MSEESIQLVQKPVIRHQMEVLGAQVDSRIAELNLKNLIATPDTIQSLKMLRSELNKELTEFENQRKTLKEAIATPYMEFESVYKIQISEKYKAAIDVLRDTIGVFEDNVKKEKEKEIKEHFIELCKVEPEIDFLKFEDAGIKILLSASMKSLKEEAGAFVQRVRDDLLLIESMDYPEESLVEYKKNGYNAANAIRTVNSRKEAEEFERRRLQDERTSKRVSRLQGLTFIYSSLTHTYNFVSDDSINISRKDVEELSDKDFAQKYTLLEIAVNAYWAKQKKTEPSEPLKAPEVVEETKEEKEPEIFEATFRCRGTMEQLKSVGQFMKDNNINYENI